MNYYGTSPLHYYENEQTLCLEVISIFTSHILIISFKSFT